MPAEPYRPASVDARVATGADLPALAETMARAFYDDPVWGWAFPDPGRRLEQHRALWRLMLESALDYKWVWLIEGCASASLWIPPGRPELRPEHEEKVGPLLTAMLGDGAARVLEAFERFEAAHPRATPHYYLSLLATHPDHRGRGQGMGLLADNLARIDAEGAAAFLESSNPANDRRYEQLGFVRCGEFELPEDGPGVTQMWRDPR
ncbi:MAG TPA: GNAT family N-acetyltransferase [Solirubrobacterales bacterium]